MFQQVLYIHFIGIQGSRTQHSEGEAAFQATVLEYLSNHFKIDESPQEVAPYTMLSSITVMLSSNSLAIL